jgi:hypothetical protein
MKIVWIAHENNSHVLCFRRPLAVGRRIREPKIGRSRIRWLAIVRYSIISFLLTWTGPSRMLRCVRLERRHVAFVVLALAVVKCEWSLSCQVLLWPLMSNKDAMKCSTGTWKYYSIKMVLTWWSPCCCMHHANSTHRSLQVEHFK